MSASALMSVAMKGMAATYAGLQTTGHNIANANVEGYTRQRATLATAQGMFTGAGFFGRGVDVVGVERDFNQFLAGEAASTGSQAAFDRVRHEQLQSLQSLFLGGESGLGAQVGNLLNAFVDVASRPQDLAARQVVLSQADMVAARFREASDQIDTLQHGVSEALRDSVTQINDLATQLASVNDRIAKLKGSEHDPNDLLDLRNRLVSDLAGYLPITTLDNPNDNTVGVFIAGGQQLVLGARAQQLSLAQDEYDSSRVAIRVAQDGGGLELDARALVSGSVGGLLKFQNDDLVRARSLLGQMAGALGSAVNTAHQAGTDLLGQAGQAMFDLGPIGLVLPSSGNTGTHNVSVAVDTSLARPAEYELSHDGTAWRVRERPSGDLPAQATDALGRIVVDGMTIDLGTPAPATSQRFLLQPVARAAAGMASRIDDPRLLAAASATAENGNALALVALRDAPAVGRSQASPSAAVQGGSTFTDAWASAMSDIGVRVQGAKTSSEISGAMADSAKASLASASGVNLDEEAAILMQQQQSYQACAKVLQIAQQVFQELLSVAGA